MARMDPIDRFARWVDLVRIVLYGLIAAAVGLAVFATKIQFGLSEVKADVEGIQGNIAHYRDIRHEKDLEYEHRITALEIDDAWLKKGYRQH